MRLIDADELLNEIDRHAFDFGLDDLLMLEDVINDMPTVEQKHGHWIDVQRERWIYAKCSECGKVSDTSTPYCAYCGSKNNEVTKDE